MALIRTGYELRFEDISPGNADFGRVCLVPWDAGLFGFAVASYRVGSPSLDDSVKAEFRDKLLSWLSANHIALCACSISATNLFWKQCLPELGFRFIDFGLRVSLANLQAASLPKSRVELRIAEQADWEEIEAIAATAFHHGRYHADPLFPKDLANLRYRQWIRNALGGQNAIDRVYVMGPPGQVRGFYHLTIEDKMSDLRLAAVRQELQGTAWGVELYLAALHLVKASGVQQVVTSISASNTGVMNIYAMCGFRFDQPDAVYHWRPDTRPA